MNAVSYEQLLERGLESYARDEIEGALEQFRAALQLRPNDAEAASLLGLALSRSAWAAQAEGFLRNAVDREPDQIPFRMNLVEGLERIGQPDKALAEVRAVIVRAPGHVRAWEKSGDLAAAMGDAEGAQTAWSRARMLAPDAPTPALKLAHLAAQQGQPDRAHEILDQVVARAPNDRRVWMIRCQLLAAQHRWSDYAAAVDAWLNAHPRDAEAWRAAARLHFENGRYRDAANAFGRALVGAPDSVPDLITFASLCLQALDVPAATGALERAAALEPENPQLLTARAQMALALGDFAGATDDCLRCLAQHPSHLLAMTTLSRASRGRIGDRELAMARQIGEDLRVNLEQRIAATFIVADALDAREQTTEAFATYQRAHELARQRDAAERRRFDATALAERRERLLTTAVPSDSAATPATALRPIFIVGMPRTGTTWVEAILAAHPEVFACGERAALPPIIDAALAQSRAGRSLEPRFVDDARRSYLAGLPSLGAQRIFTDKQPFNFEAVGLIADLFPDATIIHVRREPLATGWSIYRQEFHRAWAFAHQFADIAAVQAHEARLMQAWKARYPNRIFTVDYADLQADIAVAARRIVAACGLEWHERCDEYRQFAWPILSLAATDVRDEVRAGEPRARRYAAHLEPLAAALRQAGLDPSTGMITGS